MKTLREILTASPRACEDGLEWACNSGATTLEELWDKLERSDWMLWLYRIKDPVHKIDDIVLRRFALDCARIFQGLTDVSMIFVLCKIRI